MSARARDLGRAGRALALIVASMAIAGCSPDGGGPASPALASLAGTDWTVTTINGGNVIANARPTLAFSADRQVRGSTGCNEYSALYSTDRNRITIGTLTATEMLCDGAHGEQERAFLTGLDGAATWQLTGEGGLEIGGVATIVATPGTAVSPSPAASGTALGGTHWNLVEMGGTADFAHIVPTIDFAVDGTVSGFGGCNRFSGSYSTDDAALIIGSLASTKIGCLPPASEVEGDYLEALSGVGTWAIDSSGGLVLDGDVRLTFAAR